MTLDIAIATHRPEGAGRVAKMMLPPREGVRYVVSWQEHEDMPVPEALDRSDVTLLRFKGKGVSANRNNALDHCRGDIILIADDDIVLNNSALDAIMEVFDADPSLDLATFRADIPGKSGYPAEPVHLKRRLPEGYSVSAIEIAFRRESCNELRFCTALGAGTSLAAGEDEVFLDTAIRRGLVCRFLPIGICRHPHPSTGGTSELTPSILRGFGATIAMIYPLTVIARLPLKALRLRRNGRCGFFTALRHLASGAVASINIKRL